MQKDGVLSARLLASTPQAKELLEGQINQLKTSFTQANIQMDRIDIAQSLQDPDQTFEIKTYLVTSLNNSNKKMKMITMTTLKKMKNV
ncbi:hypothetical protein UACE39S_02691 [Ureibacillus acetophenoni]